MKLYIVRHGETVWNRHHKVQGVADIPLAENGILLAEKTGEALKNVGESQKDCRINPCKTGA